MSDTNKNRFPKSLVPAFTRLEDAHKLWHQAEGEYFNPDGFRIALNLCIQTLRSVTFVLQKNKHDIVGFDEWYPDWQEKLKADKILTWSVQARNQIVKQGDLELHSVLRVSIVSSYYASPYKEFSLSPNSRTEDIIDSVIPKKMPEYIYKHGFLKLERRWIAESLPSHELLDALNHCYSTLSLLLYDIWNILDSDASSPVLASGALPCMIRSNEDRTLWIRLATGKIEATETVTVPQKDLGELEEIIARYGPFKIETPTFEVSFLRKTAIKLFQYARVILQKDKYHDFLIFLILPGNKMEMMKLLPEDQADKYRLWREVATRVAKTDAVGVISISEAWLAQYDHHKGVHAAEYPNRTEALHMTAISKDGEEFILVAEFTRKDDEIILSDTVEEELGEVYFLEPIRNVWQER